MMTDPTDGGTVRYHRADWVPERDRWVVTFPGGRVQGFTAEQGEAMGLTSPEPEAAPLVVTCNGHSVDLSDEEAEFYTVDWEGTVDHSPHGSCATKLAGLLRDARQDPQPAPAKPRMMQSLWPSTPGTATHALDADSDDTPEFPTIEWVRGGFYPDTFDFDALPIGTVAEVTLLDGDRLLALKDGDGPDYKWYVGDSSVVDITRLRDVRVVYRPAPVSPGECLRGLLAGRDDADELIEYAKQWGGRGLTPDGRWRAVIGDAARGGA
jgi:hypothetical protein